MAIIDTALKLYQEQNVTAIPVIMPNKTPPKGFEWRVWEPMDIQHLTECWQGWQRQHGENLAIAIRCGEIEALDVDVKNDPTGQIAIQFAEALERELPQDVFESLYIQGTRTGGAHYWYKVRKEDVMGNQPTLCRVRYTDADRFMYNSDEESGVLLETRGNGGYCIIAPTPGYTIVNGSIHMLPTLDTETRDLILMIARSFNTYETPSFKSEAASNVMVSGKRPGVIYQETVSLNEFLNMLAGWGWREIKHIGDKIFLNRPGAKHPNKHDADISVSRRTFMNYSSSVGQFDPHKGYSLFSVYGILNHAGDFKAAARALAGDGFKEEKQTVRVMMQTGPIMAEGEDETPAILAKLAPTRLKLAARPTREYNLFVQESRFTHTAVAFLGAMIVIMGGKKSRKTTLLTAIIASALRGEPVLCFDYKDTGPILWIDTEQEDVYFWKTYWRICVQAGGESDRLHAYSLLDYPPEERIKMVTELIMAIKPSILVIDGVVDLVRDFNHLAECKAFVDETIMAWRKVCTVFAVIHQNKGDANARGHLGGFLVQKCTSAIQIEGTGIYTLNMVNTDSRGPRFDAISFNAEKSSNILYLDKMPNYDLNMGLASGYEFPREEPGSVAPEPKVETDDLPF